MVMFSVKHGKCVLYGYFNINIKNCSIDAHFDKVIFPHFFTRLKQKNNLSQ